MSKKFFGAFIVITILLSTLAIANEQPQPGQQSVQDANRFLTAESVNAINNAKVEMLEEMKEYQDTNFRIFDARMHDLVNDMLVKFILVGIGAFLLGGAVTVFVLMKQFKLFALERYLQVAAGQNSRANNGQVADHLQHENMSQLQSGEEYSEFNPEETVSTEFGQERASELSSMNAWQATPTYSGANNQSPVNVEREYRTDKLGQRVGSSGNPYDYTTGEFVPEEGHEGETVDDPMDSPQWDPNR